MKDILQDIVSYTNCIGGVDIVKINGTASETKISAVTEDKSVIVVGATAAPVGEFVGVFGMPNLSKLKTILGFDLYDENANITMIKTNRDGVDVPTAIHFETPAGDFVNDYRLMSQTLVDERVKNVTFKGATWAIDFEPTVNGIGKLKKQHQANSDETSFVIRTDGTDLKIHFGDPSTHSGNFVFQPQITGKLSKTWLWPVKQFLSIMDLAGIKHIYISDQGVMKITVDSGITHYEYLLPAQSR
jgi:hypothetical protein